MLSDLDQQSMEIIMYILTISFISMFLGMGYILAV